MRDSYHDLIISKTFRNVALSLVAIFLPIYLLKLGISFHTILIFEVATLFLGMLLHYILNYTFNYIGVKKMIMYSYFLSFFYYGVLLKAEQIITNVGEISFLVIIGITVAIYNTAFWLGYHNYFVHVTTKKEAGNKFGMSMGIPILVSILSPFIGSLLITAFGFQGTFVATIILLLFGSFALFLSKEIRVKPDMNIKRIIDSKHSKRNWLFFVEGFILVPSVFCWPILLYFLGVSIKLIGLLYLISNIAHALIIMWSGKQVDKQNYKVVNLGVWGFSLSYFIRAFFRSILIITGAQSLGGLSSPFWSVPMHALTYKKIKQHNKHLILTREMYMHLGRISLFIIMIGLISQFNPIFILSASLVLGGIAAFAVGPLLRELY